MAIVWWENFEWATTATLGYRLDLVGISVAVVTGISGLSGNCLRLPTANASGDIGIPLPASYSEGLFSTAMFIPSGTFTQSTIIGLYSGGTSNILIRLNTDGSLSALRSNTTLGSSAAGVVPANKRFRIEVGFVISDTVGSVKVNIDQGSGAVTVLNLTNQDTNNGVATINRMYVDVPSLGHFLYYDDMWFDTDKTAFRADQTFIVQAVSADVSGVSTPSTGSDRFALIDELPASTTDYVTFNSLGEDVYDLANLASTPSTISGVGLLYVASKPDAGSMSFRSRIKSNTDYGDGVTTGLSMTTLAYTDFWATDPQGGGAWTAARVNALRACLERIS